MEPPNPVAARLGPPVKQSKAWGPVDTGLHGRQRGFMKGLNQQAHQHAVALPLPLSGGATAADPAEADGPPHSPPKA
jgi:hypothetical protein